MASDIEVFLTWLREYQPKGYLYLLAQPKEDGPIVQNFMQSGLPLSVLVKKVKDLMDDHNVWVGMATYSKRKATKEFALASRFVWIDHDGNPEADPYSWDPRPHVVWKTSEGRYQAVWLLEEEQPQEKTESISRSLAKRWGADMGGWDITQVLRVPGSLNHKHNPPFQTSLLWKTKESEQPPDTGLVSLVAAAVLPVTVSSSPGIPETGSRDMAIYLMGRYEVPGDVVKECFLTEQTDRSVALYRLMVSLIEHGAPTPDIYTVSYHSANQKFATLERLWEDVLRTYAKSPSGGLRWRASPLSDLIPVDEQLRWIVPVYLYEDAVGTIVGEPSARKSWVALQLNIAVSCPEAGDYFGQPVLIHGPSVYLNLDDQRPRRLKVRARNILSYYRKGNNDLDIPLWWVNSGFNFMDAGWERGLKDELDRIEQIQEEKVVLTTIDTLHRAGFNPKDYGTNAQILLDGLGNMAVERKTAFIVVHHTSKGNKDTRDTNIRNTPWGSIFTGASLDPTIFLARNFQQDKEDPDNTHVSMNVWSKEGPEQAPMLLSFGRDPTKYEVEVQEADITSLVLMELQREGIPITQAEMARRLDIHHEEVRRAAIRLAPQVTLLKVGTKNTLFLAGMEEEKERLPEF